MSSTSSSLSVISAASSSSGSSTSTSSSSTDTTTTNSLTPMINGSNVTTTSGKTSHIKGTLFTTQVTFTSTLATLATAGATISLSGSVSAELASKDKSGNVNTGTAAGIAIATAIVGIIIGIGLMMLLTKKKKRSRKSRSGHAFGESTMRRGYDEKATGDIAAADFDLDRLLPQPSDDGTIREEGQRLFATIDAHVENFYTDRDLPSDAAASLGGVEYTDLLVNPATRFFAVKRIICQKVLASLDPACPEDRSLLPGGFSRVGSQVKPLDLDDRANSLCWSRLRTSFAYLARNETTEKARLNHSIENLVNELDEQLQGIELPGQGLNRRQDLDSICRASARLGKVLFSQPALWSFDWDIQSTGPGSHKIGAPAFVYFPGLVRLTNNKGEKERTPHFALQARIMH